MGADLVANGLLQTGGPGLHRFLLPSLTPALDLAVPGTAWVTDETENSLDVEWENPLTEVDYYKLQYGPLTGQEVAEVTVPKSGDPKSRYDITGKSQQSTSVIEVIFQIIEHEFFQFNCFCSFGHEEFFHQHGVLCPQLHKACTNYMCQRCS